MTIDWNKVVLKLKSYPSEVHRVRPPCPPDRIRAAEASLGKFPTEVVDMLGHFNGARLFNISSGGELLALFGVSEDPPLPHLEWNEDWYIDRFTPQWRGAGNKRERDLVIGMTNYGGLIVLDSQGLVREWDTSQMKWDLGPLEYDKWMEDMLSEGQNYLKEQ